MDLCSLKNPIYIPISLNFSKLDLMSTPPPIRSDTPHSSCHATKEELLSAGSTVLEDCRICLDGGILVRVGCHLPSHENRGYFNGCFKNTNFFLSYDLTNIFFSSNILRCPFNIRYVILFLLPTKRKIRKLKLKNLNWNLLLTVKIFWKSWVKTFTHSQFASI